MSPHLHRRSTYHMYDPETLPSYHESQAAEHDGKGKKKSIEGDIGERHVPPSEIIAELALQTTRNGRLTAKAYPLRRVWRGTDASTYPSSLSGSSPTYLKTTRPW